MCVTSFLCTLWGNNRPSRTHPSLEKEHGHWTKFSFFYILLLQQLNKVTDQNRRAEGPMYNCILLKGGVTLVHMFKRTAFWRISPACPCLSKIQAVHILNLTLFLGPSIEQIEKRSWKHTRQRQKQCILLLKRAFGAIVWWVETNTETKKH